MVSIELYRTRDSPHFDMSSIDIAVSPSIRRDETVLVSLLLAFTGGYLDAFAWIVHGVIANAQTANLVLLWVYGTTGEWTRAPHFVPPMAAFAVGIVMATWLRRVMGERAGGLPVVALLIALFRCERGPDEEHR